MSEPGRSRATIYACKCGHWDIAHEYLRRTNTFGLCTRRRCKCEAFEKYDPKVEEQEDAERYKTWKLERVSEDPSVMAGVPVFMGTRIPVRKIGAMLLKHGVRAVAEIREDYPELTDADLAFAPQFAATEGGYDGKA